MATQIRATASEVNESGWSVGGAGTPGDNVCSQSNGGGTRQMYVVLAAGSIAAGSFITAFHVRLTSGVNGTFTSYRFYVSNDNGSSYCSGHDIGPGAAAACVNSAAGSFIECTHVANYPNTKALWETASNNRIRVETVGGGAPDSFFLDYLEAQVTYGPGYDNKVAGVSGVNKVMGISAVLISKVSGAV